MRSTSRELARALAARAAETGITQSQIAETLGVDRAVITRALSGAGNLTLRTIADIAWALDCDVRIELAPKPAAGPEPADGGDPVEFLLARLGPEAPAGE